ncbi:hypothetical protein [Nostoc sp. MS1]|uniref:hypothetical protein n=1 Tax=Nostoc sp. MS1 TaxID=2764711 RepID=UPI001CC779D1|nr:hypothetical protein [Nostoc sp. MS1]BCL39539.1 hypothetical protein NSMS1_59860 [Nostoc sp. MS1]
MNKAMASDDVQLRYQSSALNALFESVSKKFSMAVVLIGSVVIIGWIKDISLYLFLMRGVNCPLTCVNLKVCQ